jgi:hypothetical protein
MLDYKRLRTRPSSFFVLLQRVDDAQFELPALVRLEQGLDLLDAQREPVDVPETDRTSDLGRGMSSTDDLDPHVIVGDSRQHDGIAVGELSDER